MCNKKLKIIKIVGRPLKPGFGGRIKSFCDFNLAVLKLIEIILLF